MTIYETCSAAHSNDLRLVMQCVSNWVESESTKNKLIAQAGIIDADDFTSWLLVLTGALVFFMQAGFAMVCAGAVRKKNVQNTMLKNLLDACGAGIAFYCVGFAFAFGDMGSDSSTFIGNNNYFLMGDVNSAFFFFQYAFSASCATIVAGTVAERCKMVAYLFYSLFLSGFVYPVVAHNVWSNTGLFSTANSNPAIGTGMVDFSGSGVIHLTGGITALYATYILGARRGRFYDGKGNMLSKPGLTKGHSTALQMLGTMVLWFGWYGFNPGSALLLTNVPNKGSVGALAAVTTTIAAAAGTISALLTNGIIRERREGEFTLDIVMAMNGCLSGLVAITAGCAVVEPWAALLIGIISGWVYIGAEAALLKLKLDDAVSAIPVHLGSGLWGVLATGFFAAPDRLLAAYGKNSHPGWFYAPASSNLMPAQLVGILFIVGWTAVTMLPFFTVFNYMGWFRVNELDELIGLDASYDGTELMPSLQGDESSAHETERVAAFKKRFQERKEIREKKLRKKMSIEKVLNSSWGEVEFASDGQASVDGMDISREEEGQAVPEQAPRIKETVEL